MSFNPDKPFSGGNRIVLRRNINAILNALVQNVEGMEDLVFDLKHDDTDSSTWTKMSLTVSKKGIVPIPNTYRKHCTDYGLHISDHNIEVTFADSHGMLERGRIVDINPRRRKYPIVLNGKYGEKYHITAAEALRRLGRKK